VTLNFDLQIAHHVADVGQERWDSLNHGHPFSSYRWHQFGERVLAGDFPVYIVASRDGVPVARCALWLTREEPLPTLPNLTRSVMQAALRRWPLLICRTPLAKSTGLILPDDPQIAASALEAMTQAAQEFGRQHGVSFLLFDYLEPAMPAPANFSQFAIPDPGTSLHLTTTSFETYIDQIGKSARKDYRRHCNRAADQGIVVCAHSSVTQLEPAMQLIRAVEDHHGSPHDPHIRLILENAHRVDSIWLTAEIENHLVGCGLLIGDGDTLSLAALGLDYDVQYVYFQLMYAAIRHAAESGTRILRGGSGAYELKERLGFQLETNNNIAVTASSRVLRQVIHRLMAS
jgi:predicted N-acyltransferase